MNLRKPSITKLAFDSPGCTLAHTIMYFLNLLTGSLSLSSNSDWSISIETPSASPVSYLTFDVTVSIGTSNPLREWQNLLSLMNGGISGDCVST